MSNVINQDSRELKWLPLLSTPEFQLFLQHLKLKGGTEAEIEGIEKLFWLLNLNPRLTAHHQIFENLLVIFESDIFKSIPSIISGGWCLYIENWVTALKIIVNNNFQFEVIVPSFKLNRSLSGGHPMAGFGMTRHPQSSALWARHESTIYYPPDINNSAGINYFMLQAHFCICQIKSRSSTNFNEYLLHSGPEEHAPRSPKTGPISTNLRDCFSSTLDNVVRDINPLVDTLMFLKNISLVNLKSDAVTETNRTQLSSIFKTIKVHFKGMLREFEKGRKKREDGERESYESFRERGYLIHPGCRMITENLWLSPPEDEFDDEYLVDTGQEVFVLDGDKTQDNNEIRSGSAPFENPKPILKLYFKDQIGGAMTRARQQHQAKELAQQNFSWDYQYLTSQERLKIENVLNEILYKYINNTGKSNKSIYDAATAALIMKIENAFSVSSEVALSTVFIPFDEVEPEGCLALKFGGTDLYLWSLHAIGPIYKESVNWDQSLNHPLTSRLYLPDVFSLGPEIEAYLKKSSTKGTNVFHSNISTVRKNCIVIFKSFKDERLTQTKMRKSILAEIQKRSMDPTVTWLLSSNINKRNDSRMFYSRYPIQILSDIYKESAQALLSTNCKTETTILMKSRRERWQGSSIGARFVMKIEAFKNLVFTLSSLLTKKPDVNSDFDVIEYHNNYLVYVILFQNICTSYRSVNNPVSIFNYWAESGLRFASLADKDNKAEEFGRLCVIPPSLSMQFEHYQRHLSNLKHFIPNIVELENTPSFFWLDHKHVAQQVTEGWLESQYSNIGFKIPANFHRGMMRFELHKRGCSVDSTPAYLGHGGALEAFHGPRSTFSYSKHTDMILLHINAILADTNLIPIRSELQVPMR
jgi:hypothetical protein